MRRQDTLNTSEHEALPSGNVGIQTLAYVTPGCAATQADVGGTRDTWSAQGNYAFYHGKTGTRANFDGFRNQYYVNDASGVGSPSVALNSNSVQNVTTAYSLSGNRWQRPTTCSTRGWPASPPPFSSDVAADSGCGPADSRRSDDRRPFSCELQPPSARSRVFAGWRDRRPPE
jgi:hypothetical protein